jgi:alkylated DNA repair dioxygenase AlkB
MHQPDLFESPPASGLPPGFAYKQSLLTAVQAAQLVQLIEPLPFKEFEFHGFTGKRRVVSFGWKYDFSAQRAQKIAGIPAFLHPVRECAADFAGMDPANLQQVLVTEYGPGASIGWHKDKNVFDEIVGISLGASCIFRFRKKQEAGWARRNLRLEPGSAYLLSGEARSGWEHSIPAVEQQRYSITFRSMRVLD